MAKISETELQRRLRSLERGSSTGSSSYSGTSAPSVNSNYKENDTFYNSTTNNLWVFSDGDWEVSNKQLHVRYSDKATNVSVNGTVTSQLDIVGFSELPFSADGIQKSWRGIWWGSVIASTDPTDYEWTYTSGAGAVSVDIYSTNGTVFHNDTGSTQLRADVAIGGALQTDVDHTSYSYKWSEGSDIICIDSNGNVVSDGFGNIYTDTVAVTCQSRSVGFHRADSTNSTVSLYLRQITLDATDIVSVSTLRCEVANIP